MALAAGTKLGPYEIQSPLGAGGMGEVYRASDTRLERAVAIKVLPPAMAQDADRLRRFEQEARTIAALNHPNILGIHDIGTYNGAPFLVSEFLEGVTLRERLQAGPLPVRRAIEYALGIAQGLAAAHEKGIVHRDLKPENIFITRDDRIKILDFGLAKLVRPEARGESAETLATGTLAGVVMGTVGYMSPEQVRGDVSDARSDIFSFGTVLYEMLTAQRAFKRETSAETMTAVLREEAPELTETGWQGPLGMQRILTRCLEKRVEQRFQSASDLAFAIESLSGTSSAKSVAQPAARRAWLPWAAALAIVAALAGGAWWAGRWSAARPQPKFTRLTYLQGYVSNARFAKDGQTVVYSAAGLLGADGISAVDETGFAERGTAGTVLERRGGTGGGSGVPPEFSEWHDGAGADGRGRAPVIGKRGDCSGLCAGWEGAGGGASCEPESATGVSGRGCALHDLRLPGLRAGIAERETGGVCGASGIRG
jgi:hypothetical protein